MPVSASKLKRTKIKRLSDKRKIRCGKHVNDKLVHSVGSQATSALTRSARAERDREREQRRVRGEQLGASGVAPTA